MPSQKPRALISVSPAMEIGLLEVGLTALIGLVVFWAIGMFRSKPQDAKPAFGTSRGG